MLRFPDVSTDEIVFVYAGDLWIVPKTGGAARRLSSPKGQEMLPKFSPDGTLIAFSGNYDGNTDVYTIPARGGTPTRLTHHPESDQVVEWYPDGKNILYRSMMNSPSRRFNQFFKQPVAGGLPEALPLAYAELASFSPDGLRMAFQFISCEFRTWKRYQGGMASDLWIYDFVNNTSEKFTDFAGTDAVPDVARGHDLLHVRPRRAEEAQPLGLRPADETDPAGHEVHRVRREVAEHRARRHRLRERRRPAPARSGHRDLASP